MYREAPGRLAAREQQRPRSNHSPVRGEKTNTQWRTEQNQFTDLPKLPEGWIRIRPRRPQGHQTSGRQPHMLPVHCRELSTPLQAAPS